VPKRTDSDLSRLRDRELEGIAEVPGVQEDEAVFESVDLTREVECREGDVKLCVISILLLRD